MDVIVKLPVEIHIDRPENDGIWTKELEADGGIWSCEYIFEDGFLNGYVNCNKKYVDVECPPYHFSTRNQFVITGGSLPNISSERSYRKKEYYKGDIGHVVAYREKVCTRDQLRKYTDDNGNFTVVVTISELENKLHVADPNDEYELRSSDIIVDETMENWLGKGTDADVYKGRYRGLEEVAVKIFRKPAPNTDGDPFLDEVKIFKLFKHKNLLTFRGFLRQGRSIVLDLCPNGTVAEYVHKHKKELSPALLCEWVAGILDGLAYLHEKDVIHRDLKTSNILITKDFQVQLGDFSRSKSGPITAMTFQTNKKGTCGYMAPEVLTDNQYTRKIDIWSFGVILWELCSRVVPFRGLNDSIVNQYIGQRELTLPALPVPIQIKDIIAKCMSFNAEQRPSAADIIELWKKARSSVEEEKNWTQMAEDVHKFAMQIDYSPMCQSRGTSTDISSSTSPVFRSATTKRAADELAADNHLDAQAVSRPKIMRTSSSSAETSSSSLSSSETSSHSSGKSKLPWLWKRGPNQDLLF